MGYFKNIRDERRKNTRLGQPSAGLGKAEEERISYILDDDFYDRQSGAPAGAAYERVSEKEDGATVTSLVLPSGEIAAQATEWEMVEHGKRVSYANVVFNEKYSGEGSYTIRREYGASDRVSVLEENNSRRYISYYGNGGVAQTEEERPSKNGLSKKYGMKDRTTKKYAPDGKLMSKKSVSFAPTASNPRHVNMNCYIREYEYSKENERLTKKTTLLTKELVRGKVNEGREWRYSKSEREFFRDFDNDAEIPGGFTKLSQEETSVSYRGEKLEKDLHRIKHSDGRFGEKETDYHENGLVKSVVEKYSMVEDYTHKTFEEHSETGEILTEGSVITESAWLNPKTSYFIRHKNAGPEEPFEEAREITRYQDRKDSLEFIGFHKRYEGFEEKLFVDSEGRSVKETHGISIERSKNIAVETYFDENNRRTKQVTTIKSPDENKEFRIEKKYDGKEVTDRKVTVNGKEVPKGSYEDGIFTVRSSRAFKEPDERTGKELETGRKEMSVSYDEDGKMHSAKEKYIDYNTDLYSIVSYSRTKEGLLTLRKDGEGNIEESVFVDNNGEERRKQSVYESKYVKAFIVDGHCEADSRLHDSGLSEELPAAVTFDLANGIVTIEVHKDAEMSAAEIAEELWGSGAEGDGCTAHSPKGVEMHPKELVTAVEAIEKMIEPAETLDRAKELSEIRSETARAVRENIKDKGLDLNTVGLE